MIGKKVTSFFLGLVLLLPLTSLTPISAQASVSTTLVNTIPTIDPQTETIVPAGVIGDTVKFNASGLTGTVHVQFTGGAQQTASSLAPSGSNNYSVVVPTGAITGPVTITDDQGGSATASFQVWPSRDEPYVMPAGHLNVTYQDLQFILDQIKMSEAHAARTVKSYTELVPSQSNPTIIYPYDVTSTSRCLINDDVVNANNSTFGSTGLSNTYVWTTVDPLGVRQVDGQCNNISNVMQEAAPTTVYSTPSQPADTAAWGAGDQLFTRLSPATDNSAASSTYTLDSAQQAYQVPSNSVVDPTPRIISNLISDQSLNNPAAVAASAEAQSILYGTTGYATENSINATTGVVSQVLQIPNITADYNVSAGYNSWFTLFGQFFDHGLDLIPKAGAAVLIPINQDDPLYVPNPQAPNFMMLTRGASASGGESDNITTPYVDQSQTYGSHPSQNFFLREYSFTSGQPVPTGRLLTGTEKLTGADNGGLATWRDLKAQALKLGFVLTDYDAKSIPVVATDQYGKFIPGPHGFPMMLFSDGGNPATSFVWKEGSASSPIKTGVDGTTGDSLIAVGTGHSFINDTMASAVPYQSQCQSQLPGGRLAPDADHVMNAANAQPSCTTYDNESLDEHYVAGDGRVNENIGLSAIHDVFHSEHNLLVQDIKDLLANDKMVSAAFVAEWSGARGGERLYQAARFVMEMEYQHMAYDEFIRRIAPNLPIFLSYDPSANADISAEFASAVYRLGHSMLNETIARSNPGTFYDPTNNQDVSLLTAFTNPPQARLPQPAGILSVVASASSLTFTMKPGQKAPLAGEIVSISGMFNPGFNIANAVVDTGATSSSFTVHTAFQSGNELATPITIPAAVSGPNANAADPTKLALVTISDPGTNPYAYTPGASAAAIAQGMSSQRGNEIDEFVTDGVRNNLLGLPLDLASLNITRGRDVGLPTLNQFRGQHSTLLPPYTSWSDFIYKLRHRDSGANFVAAYGTHSSITSQVNVATISSATGSGTSGTSNALVTYNYVPALHRAINVGDVVTITGMGQYSYTNAIVSGATPNQFTISAISAHSASEVAVITDPSALTHFVTFPNTSTVTGTGIAKRDPNVAERRAAGIALTTKAIQVEITDASFDHTPRSYSYLNSSDATVSVSAPDGSITYSGENTYYPGQLVTISGVVGATCFNRTSAKVLASDAATFTIAAPSGFSDCGYKSSGPGATSGGTGNYSSNGDSAALEPPSDASQFINSTSSYAPSGDWATNTTGINAVDLWIGGLAEIPSKQPITPSMLGPTFQFVFDDQSLKLQNGDRFYYLGRLPGTNLGEEIPAQKFTDIIRRNTPSVPNTNPGSGIIGMVSPGFGITDCAFSSNSSLVPGSASCGSGTMTTTSIAGRSTITHNGLDNVTGFADSSSSTGVALAGGAGDDSIQGGPGNDLLSGGLSGGDLIDGAAGNDIIFGGPGEDLLKGGAGNDIVNTGTSQIGDIADGGSGSDFIHCGNCQGIALSFLGEAGNDFIQGGQNSDLLLGGGEGNDWVEGGGGWDIMNGDNGLPLNLTIALPSLHGGNDVLSGGAGQNIENGDGGDDIFLLGNGPDTADGSFGFDWADYEYNIRYDNGPAARPGAWVDLTGATLNPLNTSTGDFLVNLEGVSGSAGNDILFGGVGINDTVIPRSNTKFAATGSKKLVVRGALNIVGGSVISGVGIAPNTTVLGLATITAGNTTTINLSSLTTADVFGPLTVTTYPLTTPSEIAGLTELVSGTPGWNKYTSLNPSATTWSGGAIILGGDGNDSLLPSTGNDVIHGSDYLHACISVTHGATPSVIAAEDVPCGGGRGFSGMSLIAPFMDSGILQPGDLQIVREIRSTSIPVTSVSSTNGTITYTASNNFYVGESVSIAGLISASGSDLSPYILVNALVSSADASSFRVNIPATPDSGAPIALTDGSVVATDTLDLSGGVTSNGQGALAAAGGISGTANQFAFAPLTTPLPAGTTVGCKITGPGGAVIIAYDVQMVKFTTGTAVPITGCGGGNPPAAPMAPTVVAGESSATISWSAPASNGSPIDFYNIGYTSLSSFPAQLARPARGRGGRATTNTVVYPSSGDCFNVAFDRFTCTITGLPTGNYLFEVDAHNTFGDSAWSPSSSSTHVVHTPAPISTSTTTIIPPTIVGSSSPLQTVTIKNTGDAPLVEPAIVKSGTNASDFTLGTDNCSGHNIAVNGTCTIAFTFTPSDVGSRTATLSFADNTVGTPSLVTLTGTGLAAAFSVGSSSAAVSSAPVNVGYAPVNSQTIVTLSRSGTSGSNPTTVLSVTGGTWTVSSLTNVTSSSTTVSAGSPAIITLTGASGSYSLNLNPGSPVGTYTASDTAKTPLHYSVTVGASAGAYAIASSVATPLSTTVSPSYSAESTNTTVQLTRSGTDTSSQAPSTILTSGPGATWTVTTGSGTSASSTTLTSGANVTISLTGATGTYNLSLNSGAAPGRTYTVTDAAGMSYSVTVNSTTSPYSIGTSLATPQSSTVTTSYNTGTTSTVELTRAGTDTPNPTTTLHVDGGSWTVTPIDGVTASSATLNSTSPVDVTLTAGTGHYTLKLESGSPAGTYTVSDSAGVRYVVTVSGTQLAYSIASSSTPTSATLTSSYTSPATTVTLNRSGNSGSAPTTVLSVTGGTWTISSATGVDASSTTISYGSPSTITLNQASGSYSLSLAAGLGAGTYTASDTSGFRYVATVNAAPGTLTISTSNTENYSIGNTITLAVNGAVPGQRIVYTTDNSPTCVILANTLSSLSPASCTVTATEVVSPSQTLTATKTFTFGMVSQATLVIAGNPRTAVAGRALGLKTSGGSGAGAVSFSLPDSPVGHTQGVGCQIVQQSGNYYVNAPAATTCWVVAKKESSSIYAEAFSAAFDFIFT